MIMDRETIIKLADENGLWDYFDLEGDSVGLLMLERLAKLVRDDYSFTHAQLWIKRINDAVVAEREACAKVCEEDESGRDCNGYYAEIIRARGYYS